MKKFSVLWVLVSLIGFGTAAGSAVPNREMATDPTASSGIELIAFEAPGCTYCTVFRRDVLPGYGVSAAAKKATLRFVDLNDEAAGQFRLTRAVSIVPTVVVMKDGAEIGRIDGYVGRETFYRLLEDILPRP